MTIYIDELFVNNLLITYLIMVITGEILFIKYKNGNLLIASFIATMITIFLIIYELNANVLVKITIAILLVKIGFQAKEIRNCVIEVTVILIITFLIGGIVKSSTESSYELIAYLLIIFLGLKKYVQYYKEKKWKLRNTYELEMHIENKKIILAAFLDTGNFLNSCFLDEPVIVVSEKCIKNNLPKPILELLSNGKIDVLKINILKDIRVVNYSTLNSSFQNSYGLKLRGISIKYGKNMILRDAVIILSKELKKFDAIIGISLLEGRIGDGNFINVKTESEEIIC